MKIERQRIGPFDAQKSRSKVGSQHRQGTIRPVNVKPEFLAARPIGEAREIVNGAGVHGSRGSHNQKGFEAGLAVFLDRIVQRR